MRRAVVLMAVGTWVAAAEVRAQTPIACGQDVEGEISSPAEVDAFSFTGASGDGISLAFAVVQVTLGFFDPVWELRSPSDAVVDGGNAESQFTLPEDGTYTLRVSDLGANGAGRYGLSVQGVSEGASCGALLGCGQSVNDALVRAGDSDAFRFVGVAGEVASITLGDSAAPPFDPLWKLFAPSGALVGSSTDQAAFALAESGEYTVLVIDHVPGSYTVTVQFVSDGASCGTPIACGGYASQTLGAPGDTDTFAFSGAPGDVYSITLERASSESDFGPQWRAFSPAGTQAGLRVMEAGTHTIEVHDSGSDAAGSYGLSLQGVSEPSSCGPVASCDPRSSGTLEPGDSDAFRVVATAGDRVSIESFLGARWRLFDPNGVSVATSFTRQVRNLDATGIWTVEVVGAGSYELAVCGCEGPDGDGDGVQDTCDNCPFLANANQQDTGGVGTATPDGVGNLCQCGDITNNGLVNGGDGTFITRHAVGYNDPLFVDGGKCDVTGNGLCNGQDGVFVTRAALGYLDPLTVAPQGQNCHNADPAAPPCPSCAPCPLGTCD